MLELTLLLVLAAGVIWVLFKGPTRKRRAKAEEAARRAVEARLDRDDRERGGGS